MLLVNLLAALNLANVFLKKRFENLKNVKNVKNVTKMKNVKNVFYIYGLDAIQQAMQQSATNREVAYRCLSVMGRASSGSFTAHQLNGMERN